jgi:hypothetical protein
VLASIIPTSILASAAVAIVYLLVCVAERSSRPP